MHWHTPHVWHCWLFPNSYINHSSVIGNNSNTPIIHKNNPKAKSIARISCWSAVYRTTNAYIYSTIHNAIQISTSRNCRVIRFGFAHRNSNLPYYQKLSEYLIPAPRRSRPPTKRPKANQSANARSFLRRESLPRAPPEAASQRKNLPSSIRVASSDPWRCPWFRPQVSRTR